MYHCGNTGVEWTLNKESAHKVDSGEILPPPLPGFKLTTFGSWVQRSYQSRSVTSNIYLSVSKSGEGMVGLETFIRPAAHRFYFQWYYVQIAAPIIYIFTVQKAYLSTITWPGIWNFESAREWKLLLLLLLMCPTTISYCYTLLLLLLHYYWS